MAFKSQSCDVRQQGRSGSGNSEKFTFQQMKNSSTVPKWQKPIFVGDFSSNGEQEVIFDKSGLSYIKLDWDQVNFDLNAAIDKVKKKVPNSDGGNINSLLKYLSENTDQFREQEESSMNTGRMFPDFVCQRGLLTKIMCHASEDWTFHATKYHGTIYLRQEKYEEEMTDEHTKFCTWGYKFEHYMTEGADPNTGNDETVCYVCILKSKLGSHSLGYLAEVDGADRSLYDPSHKDLSAFVELKTRKLIESEWDRKKLIMHKTADWWCQSFLIGIPRIICGYKDKNGTVTKLETFKLDEMTKEAEKFWSKDQMLFSLDGLLSFVKEKVTEDDPNLVYEFVKSDRRNPTVICRSLGEESSEKTFLPEWYINKIENRVRTE